ncbi:hydrogenase expression/formation protein HypE [Stackebrandtia nassauensis]|uniref:Hydrogenase expression/formation protein HypE n=1 Tax=Stackebrandtia nassauensis (strain DSM 44728 / CIP 108903 / NRRL B-16338 / NBRC 102104 / LLR-40K-21) TaxID=446470 RepID=D3PVJ3_STANL|nr:hydrogenase expression/formation protein HypE [Stackebrandtia nassauensis]ADD43107.1 hydrogenase expression/formation protein HypE [Stackebrandtia nassauensis DSM 44728]
MTVDPAAASCPVPRTDSSHIRLGHGSGGQLMAELLGEVITPGLLPPGPMEDAAVLPDPGGDLALSTDAFVVTPRFFPGGDIGMLAVHGTVNDLAMRGAVPIALAVSYVLEEGLPMAELRRINDSVAKAAADCGVAVVTGDTKVVNRGACDGIYITTTGVGRIAPAAAVSAANAAVGDAVLVSGPIGSHGTAILSVREGLGFEAAITSDTRPLHELVAAMLAAGGAGVHVLRDPTRGGLASALIEVAQASQVGIEITEAAVPVPTPVTAACELLGLDVWHVANEGCLIALVAPEAADAVLAAMRTCPEAEHASLIGRVTAGPSGRVTARTPLGTARVVDMLIGEQLPRIC